MLLGIIFMESSVINKINADIILKEPPKGIRFGTDALLLADFALPCLRRGKCVDLGTGSGVIPLLLLGAGCKCNFWGLELQREYADIAAENALNNGFADRFTVINGNAEDYKSIFTPGFADYVITNPPYMSAHCGYNNKHKAMDIARREVSGGIGLFCKAASGILKSGGSFFAVYRPDRLAELICAMRENGIEPKRIRVVVPSVGKKPSLLLVEGRKDGKEGMVFLPDLYIYTDNTHAAQTEELKQIYERF